MNKTEEILNERESTHGDYKHTARLSQALKATIWMNAKEKIPFVHQESLDLICTKIARIISGDPNCIDSWEDIAGYAQLVVRELQKGEPTDGQEHTNNRRHSSTV